MRTYDALPDTVLGDAGDVSREFLKLGVRDYRCTAIQVNLCIAALSGT